MPYSIDPDDIPNIAWQTKQDAVRALEQKMEEDSKSGSVDGSEVQQDSKTSVSPKTADLAYTVNSPLFSKECALGDTCSCKGVETDRFSVPDWLALHEKCMASQSAFTRRRSSQLMPWASRSPTQPSAEPDDTATTTGDKYDEEVAEVGTIQ